MKPFSLVNVQEALASSSDSAPPLVKAVKVIEKIEEKLPKVKLLGRRESTAPVLPPELAELVGYLVLTLIAEWSI